MANPPHSDQVDALASAYAELATCAPQLVTPKGPIPLAIPWTAMKDWCEWNDLDRDVARQVMRVIAFVDRLMRKKVIAAMKARS